MQNITTPTPAIVFFIGTTAELIKLLPVMIELRKTGAPFRIVASGQNEITGSKLLAFAGPSEVISLSAGPKAPSIVGLLLWWLMTLIKSCLSTSWLPLNLRNVELSQKVGPVRWVVHGDTVSTLMGAIIGWRFGFRVCHVEAGLRSFNFFRPFPEELCRILVSRLASEAFCPNAWAVGNLSGLKVSVTNTFENTLVDSLQFALEQKSEIIPESNLPERYFIFVLHRQENLLNRDFVNRMVEVVLNESAKCSAVIILHKPTQAAFERFGLLDRLRASEKIVLLPRQGYVDFTHLLAKCQFILTDGGSNQEESYYLGKPCLILRSETERKEGLEHNAVLSDRNFETIAAFLERPAKYQKPPIDPGKRPSLLISDILRLASL